MVIKNFHFPHQMCSSVVGESLEAFHSELELAPASPPPFDEEFDFDSDTLEDSQIPMEKASSDSVCYRYEI